jgi:hypothetical protein
LRLTFADASAALCLALGTADKSDAPVRWI